MAEPTSRAGGWSRAVKWLVVTCLVMALACGIFAAILWQISLKAPTLDAGIQYGLQSFLLMVAAGVSLIVGLIALAGRLWSQGRGDIVSKFASAIVAMAYVSLTVAQVGSPGLVAAPIVLIPLGLIWCSGWLGKPMQRRGGATTWPIVIASLGWLFLLGCPVLITIFSR